MEARAQTIGEFLEELFPACDIDAGLKRVQAFVENLTKVVERAVVWTCETVDGLERLPPAPGYEPVLIERGHHPLMARGLSHGIIRSGRDEANKAKMQRTVVDALRFLAKPGGRSARFPARRRCCWRYGTQRPIWVTLLTVLASACSGSSKRSRARFEAISLLVSA